MATLSKIKPGQTLYDCRKSKGWGGNKWNVWPVLVEEVYEDHAICRWNVLNKPSRYTASMLKRLRLSDPSLKNKSK